jgi:hypothetical protein
MTDNTLSVSIQAKRQPSGLSMILWRIAFAAAGVAAAVVWLLWHLYSIAAAQTQGVGFIGARVWDMTMEYLQWVVLLALNVLLTPRMSSGELAYSLFVMSAIVVASILFGSALARASRALRTQQ